MQVGDVFCWPMNLGSVVGPALLYSSFLNGFTLALCHGSPLIWRFGKFVQVLVLIGSSDLVFFFKSFPSMFV